MSRIKKQLLEESYDNEMNMMDIDYDLMEYEYNNYQPKENTNQINNNNMTKKTMTEKLNGTAYKVETKKEALRRVYL